MVRQSFVGIVSLAAVVAFASLATPLVAKAQESSPPAAAPVAAAPVVVAPVVVAPTPVVGPVHAPAGIVRADAADAEALYLQNSGSGNRNVIWMIVGGGLLLGGMIVGGDVGTVLSVTGLVVGLVGVYRYLR